MDTFAHSMIARGPTLDRDRRSATGSLHIVALAGVAAVHEFVAREPNNRAGVYAEHSVWRFENLLGRTMWEFPGATEEHKFLVIARHRGRDRTRRLSVESCERLILYGALTTLEDSRPVGVAVAVQVPDREAVAALLRTEGLGPDVFPETDIHDWEFGGRR